MNHALGLDTTTTTTTTATTMTTIVEFLLGRV